MKGALRILFYGVPPPLFADPLFLLNFFTEWGVPLFPHFRTYINSQMMINLVRCTMSSGETRQGVLLTEDFIEQPDIRRSLGVYLCAAQTPVNLY